MPHTSVIDEYAPAFFGLRAGRLTDRIIAEGGAYLRSIELKTPVPAISTMLSLRAGVSSVTEIAAQLGVTHAAVIKNVRLLEKCGFAERYEAEADARRKPVRLTQAGMAESEKITAFIAVVQDVYRDLFDEIGMDLHAGLTRMEAALNAIPFDERLRKADA